MWECKITKSPLQAIELLEKKNIKPENVKIVVEDNYLLIFYYIEKKSNEE